MDIKDTLRALADTIEQAEQRLPEFEQEAREFREKARAANAERERLESEIAGVEEKIEGLTDERNQLKLDFANAQFEGSVSEQQRITRRRSALDKELQQHEAEIQQLRGALDGLPDLVGERAGIRFGVDVGNGWGIGTDLRNEIIQAVNGLNDRIAKAYGLLPSEAECRVSDEARRAAREAQERSDLEVQRENEKIVKELEEKARLELWTKKPITENGYIVAFDIFDEYGVKVRREEATVVTK